MKRAFAVFVVLCMSTTLWGGKYFTPRKWNEKTNEFECLAESGGYPYNQWDSPRFEMNLKENFKQILEKTSCLVHGMNAKYVNKALTEQNLSSAYRLHGPDESKYIKKADLRCGGALGVYTRAVGVKQTDWVAKGYSNGSGSGKVQLVLSPVILLERYGEWRHNGMDGLGCPPGMNKNNLIKEKNKDTWDFWGIQTESGRNKSYEATVKQSSAVNLNEQLFWNNVELRGILKAIVCTDAASYNLLVGNPDGIKVIPPNIGYIKFDNGTIPVILANPNDKLLEILGKYEVAKVTEVKVNDKIVKEYRVR